MWTAVIGGILVGLSTTWGGRFLLPLFVALFSCGELYFKRRIREIRTTRATRYREAGVPYNEVEDPKMALQNLDDMILKDAGATPLSIYVANFFWMYLTTTAVSLITGLIQVLFS